MKPTRRHQLVICHQPYIITVFLLTPEIFIVPFPPKHPQCIHIDSVILLNDILDNKRQKYCNVGSKEQKGTGTLLECVVKTGRHPRKEDSQRQVNGRGGF